MYFCTAVDLLVAASSLDGAFVVSNCQTGEDTEEEQLDNAIQPLSVTDGLLINLTEHRAIRNMIKR